MDTLDTHTEINNKSDTEQATAKIIKWIVESWNGWKCMLTVLESEHFSSYSCESHTRMLTGTIVWIYQSLWTTIYSTSNTIRVYLTLPTVFDSCLYSWKNINLIINCSFLMFNQGHYNNNMYVQSTRANGANERPSDRANERPSDRGATNNIKKL